MYYSRNLYALLLNILLLVGYKSYGQDIEVVSLNVNAYFDNEVLLKDTWYKTQVGDSIQVEKLRFYLTDVSFIYVNKAVVTIPDSYYLVDVLKGTNVKIDLPVTNKKDVVGISYKIGVDDALHDAGALAGDLDPINGMYWAWQSGFINFKIEGISPSSAARKNKFAYHIGGYKKPFATTVDVKHNISLENVKSIYLNIDIATFFKHVDLKKEDYIMIPGSPAFELAQQLPSLFTLSYE